MKVTKERHLSREAFEALAPALKRSNMDWFDLFRIMRGPAWMIWNIGNVGWVFTVANEDDEIEVLLAGGKLAKECVGPWEQAMLSEPGHRGMTIRIEGRKGWRRLLPDWEWCDGILYKEVE